MNIFQLKCDEQGFEIDLLKETKIELRNVDKYVRTFVNELKLDGERNKNIILELQEEMVDNNNKIGKLNDKLQNLKSIFEIEWKLIKSIIKEIDKLKFDGDRNKKSIEAIEKKCEQQNKQIQQQIENKFVNAKQERKNIEKDLLRNIDEIKNKQIGINQTIKNVENKLLEIEIIQNTIINGEFMWRIDKINDKIRNAKNGTNKIIYSDSFYTHKHGYKGILCVNPDGTGHGEGTHLSVFFYLMKGKFDDILQWPFKHDVTFSLINQQTRLVHVSRTAKHSYMPNHEMWNKPIHTVNNDGFGFHIIGLKELSTNTNLIINNQIFVKIFVNISS